MPDLKTALSAILPEWETDQQRIEQEKHMPATPTKKYHFQPTNNITRITYDYIAKHPNKTQPEVVAALVAQGHKEGSVASLCSQFVRQGLVSREEGTRKLRAVKPFTPLKSSKKARAQFPMIGAKHKNARVKKEPSPLLGIMKRKYTKKADKTAQGIAALPPQGGEQAVFQDEHAEAARKHVNSIVLSRNWSAQKEVEKLSVVQARQLYDLLKTIFGG
jgi:hypothetical protein